MRCAIEQRLGRDDEAGRAVAALDRAAVGECLVQRVGLFDRAQPGRGENLTAVGLPGEHQAAIDRHAVEHDRARAAVALLAAAFDVHVAEVAQRMQQRHVGGQGEGVRPPVDVKGNKFGFHAATSVFSALSNSRRTITSVTCRR